MGLNIVVTFIQFFFAVVIGLYFWNLLRNQQGSRVAIERESRKEIEKLRKLRSISLTEPLSERTRPQQMTDIIGQEEGVRALRAALCGPNPQHVIVYGPPGVGKTAAARLVLDEARKNPLSPFKGDAKFVELDATTARFDERGIADPLIGSVHDPIYQGAGPMGMAGIPQPKPGAVTKAHGGILFIDEIGELHPIQMNKLLKVLEDRKVYFESAYYSGEDSNIPVHIQDIFENGMPADFRLVGATTRQPHEIPPAIRSRCLEIFFRPLLPDEVGVIAQNAARKINVEIEKGAVEVVKRFCSNGREAVNMVQIAAGLAITEDRPAITQADVEWVSSSGQYTPRIERKVRPEPHVGVVNGLAVYGPNLGTLIEVEAVAKPIADGERATLAVTGVVDEEEMGALGRTIRRKSMARSSVENVLTVLGVTAPDARPDRFHLHLNLPGGVPLDGPSAGVSIATALYSAMTGQLVDNRLAMTGELSIRGEVRPVGGVVAKVEAARQAGCKRVLIPRDNWQELFRTLEGVDVIPVATLGEVFEQALVHQTDDAAATVVPAVELLTASPSQASAT
jgi:Lon-like ATP-dependent protease